LIALIPYSFTARATQNLPTLVLSGSLNTQFGYKDQSQAYKIDATGNKFGKYGIVNDTNINLGINAERQGFKYGGLINLNSDTSTSKVGENTVGHQTMVYVESSIGRFEGGSYTGAHQDMRAGAPTIARAVGGIDGDWKYWINSAVGNGKQITPPRLPTTTGGSFVANAAKLTYYAPALQGFRIGVTYIPDTEHHGTITNLKSLSRSYTKVPFIAGSFNTNQVSGYTNVIEGGFSYDGKLGETAFKFPALGEAGNAKKFFDDATKSLS
jgi:hypothetical protein